MVAGDWVKKINDDDSLYVQVITNGGSLLTLGSNYKGTTGVSRGVVFDQTAGVYAGMRLLDVDDIKVYSGDSMQVDDTLYISDIVDSSWFNINNTGTFEINQFGMTASHKPYIRVKNESAVAETNRALSVDINGLYIIEGENNTIPLIKEVKHTAIDAFDSSKRLIYLMSSSTSYKMSQTNGTIRSQHLENCRSILE